MLLHQQWQLIKEVSEFVLKSNSAFRRPFKLSKGAFASQWTNAHCPSLWIDERKIVPKKMSDAGFTWEFPTIESLYQGESFRSLLENDAWRAGGMDKLLRNKTIHRSHSQDV
eukprot:UN07938